MNMQPITGSEAIVAIGYDPGRRLLRIRYKDGKQDYDFCGVPEHIYRALMASNLKGEFYNDHIRGRYHC